MKLARTALAVLAASLALACTACGSGTVDTSPCGEGDPFCHAYAGKHWSEKWDIWEAQHMLNALKCGDAAGNPLVETSVRDKPTKEAIRRFQRGDYPDKPAEQAPLPESDFLGEAGAGQGTEQAGGDPRR